MAKRTSNPIVSRSVEVTAEMTATAIVLAETLWAAHQTIALRMARVAGTTFDPALLRDPEFARMVSEKMVAAAEAGLAVAGGTRAIGDAWLEWAGHQAVAGEQFLRAFWGMPDPMRVGRATGDLAETSLNIAEIACAQMVLEATRLAGLGLAPYHKATNANAKRLLRQIPRHFSKSA